MFFQQDVVDNFYMVINSKPTVTHPNNNNNTFSAHFPHRKDFSVNETWEVAVTTLTIPYWITNPTRVGNFHSKWLNIKLQPHGDGFYVSKYMFAEDGYFTCRGDFIKSFSLEHPIYVFQDENDRSVHTIDFDNYFNWRTSPTTDTFILDTRELFIDYPQAVLEVQFGNLLQKALMVDYSYHKLTIDHPHDHRITPGNKPINKQRDAPAYSHKKDVLVHSDLIGSTENPQKILFHSAEINKVSNHTPCGSVNLIPDRLEYHKVKLPQFSHINFSITDCNGNNFDWLHHTPVTLGLHFRKRYYINLYK